MKMNNKLIVKTSLIISIFSFLIFLLIIHFNGENISSVFKKEGLLISSILLVGVFVGFFILFKLLYKTKLKSKLLFFTITTFVFFTFYAYQNGFIGSHTLSEFFSEKINNPYNGIYEYDKSKIKNQKLLQNINLVEKKGYSRLSLNINGSGASILGTQLDSRVRNRFFTVCLEEEKIILKNGELGVFTKDYCRVPSNNKFTLQFIMINSQTFYCENCEDEDFPKYWIKTN